MLPRASQATEFPLADLSQAGLSLSRGPNAASIGEILLNADIGTALTLYRTAAEETNSDQKKILRAFLSGALLSPKAQEDLWSSSEVHRSFPIVSALLLAQSQLTQISDRSGREAHARLAALNLREGPEAEYSWRMQTLLAVREANLPLLTLLLSAAGQIGRNELEPAARLIGKETTRIPQSPDERNALRSLFHLAADVHPLAIHAMERLFEKAIKRDSLLDAEVRLLTAWNYRSPRADFQLTQMLLGQSGPKLGLERASVLTLRAIAAIRGRHLSLGEACLNSALKIDPQCQPAILATGRLMFIKGQFQEAASHFAKAAASVSVGRAEALLAAARAHVMLGNSEEAAKAYKAATIPFSGTKFLAAGMAEFCARRPGELLTGLAWRAVVTEVVEFSSTMRCPGRPFALKLAPMLPSKFEGRFIVIDPRFDSLLKRAAFEFPEVPERASNSPFAGVLSRSLVKAFAFQPEKALLQRPRDHASMGESAFRINRALAIPAAGPALRKMARTYFAEGDPRAAYQITAHLLDRKGFVRSNLKIATYAVHPDDIADLRNRIRESMRREPGTILRLYGSKEYAPALRSLGVIDDVITELAPRVAANQSAIGEQFLYAAALLEKRDSTAASAVLKRLGLIQPKSFMFGAAVTELALACGDTAYARESLRLLAKPSTTKENGVLRRLSAEIESSAQTQATEARVAFKQTPLWKSAIEAYSKGNLDLADQIFASEPNAAVTNRYRAVLAVERKRPKEALTLISEMEKRGPLPRSLRTLRIRALAMSGSNEEAWTAAVNLCELGFGSKTARFVGVMAHSLGKQGELRAWLRNNVAAGTISPRMEKLALTASSRRVATSPRVAANEKEPCFYAYFSRSKFFSSAVVPTPIDGVANRVAKLFRRYRTYLRNESA